MSESARPKIINAAHWLVDHRADCTYSEDSPERTSCIKRPFKTPFVSDCSTGVTALYYWGDSLDPNDLGFGGDPYTGTLLKHGRLISASSARSADVVIFGPDTGWHAALVLTEGVDPVCWSMGEQGDPRLYQGSVVEQAVSYVNKVDSCQVRYLRFNTTRR